MKLGCINVDRMLHSLTAKQFFEWEAYARLEPFDEVREDYRAASIVTMIANVNRGVKQQPYRYKDFLLNFEEQEAKSQQQTVEQQIALAYAIARAFNADGINT